MPDLAITMIDVEWIRPSLDNPRESLGDLTELAASITESGILQALVVVPVDDDAPVAYEILAGHRRHGAAILAELTHVPCIIRTDLDANGVKVARLAENLQRTDLTPIERAYGYEQLAETGLSQREIASAVGVNQATVSRSLALLKLPPTVLAGVADGSVSQDLAGRLAALPPEVQKEVVEDHYSTSGHLDWAVQHAEHVAEQLKAHDEKVAELREAGVTVYATWAEVGESKAKALAHELTWVKKAAHRKADCRAVFVDDGANVREYCNNPKAHPKPKAEKTTPEGKTVVDPITKIKELLDVATARRHEWLANAPLPDELSILRNLIERWLEQISIDHDVLAEVLDLTSVSDPSVLAYADSVDRARRVLWVIDLDLRTSELRSDSVTSWQRNTELELDDSQSVDARSILLELVAMGYKPSETELRRVGLPYGTPMIDAFFPTIAIEEKKSRTGPSKFKVTCSACGVVGRVAATTRSLADERGVDHLHVAHPLGVANIDEPDPTDLDEETIVVLDADSEPPNMPEIIPEADDNPDLGPVAVVVRRVPHGFFESFCEWCKKPVAPELDLPQARAASQEHIDAEHHGLGELTVVDEPRDSPPPPEEPDEATKPAEITVAASGTGLTRWVVECAGCNVTVARRADRESAFNRAEGHLDVIHHSFGAVVEKIVETAQ